MRRKGKWRAHRGSLLLQLFVVGYCCCTGYIGRREARQEEGVFKGPRYLTPLQQFYKFSYIKIVPLQEVFLSFYF